MKHRFTEQIRRDDLGRVTRSTLRRDPDDIERFQTTDDPEDCQRERRSFQVREDDAPKRAPEAGPVNIGRLKHFPFDGEHRHVIHDHRRTRPLEDVDQDDGVERDILVTEPVLLKGTESDHAKKFVDVAELEVKDLRERRPEDDRAQDDREEKHRFEERPARAFRVKQIGQHEPETRLNRDRQDREDARILERVIKFWVLEHASEVLEADIHFLKRDPIPREERVIGVIEDAVINEGDDEQDGRCDERPADQVLLHPLFLPNRVRRARRHRRELRLGLVQIGCLLHKVPSLSDSKNRAPVSLATGARSIIYLGPQSPGCVRVLLSHLVRQRCFEVLSRVRRTLSGHGFRVPRQRSSLFRSRFRKTDARRRS